MKTTKASIRNKTEAGSPLVIISHRGGYGIIETLIVIIVMGVLAVVVMSHYEKIAYEAKHTALKAELLNLRQAITLFKIMKGRFPKDLNELIDSNYIMPYQENPISKKYLEPHSLDERGNILDPYGMPYVYFPADGSVRSQKEGFEHF
ncbi:MAG: type II secretion system protein GspG [Thermodesulfovibrionales bacterium]|nr:type II secretion system protein GspG [Thermodesulfovibrionales bacterium]